MVRTVLCLECGNCLWWLAVYSICSLPTYIVYLVQLITNNLRFITVLCQINHYDTIRVACNLCACTILNVDSLSHTSRRYW